MNRIGLRFLALLAVVALSWAAAPRLAHAQTCDPATGMLCDTPTPGPTCGLPGLPPCDPPPQQPENTPAPVIIYYTSTPRPTATATSTATATPGATAAVAMQAPSNLPGPFVPPPKPSTPRSLGEWWGGLLDGARKFFSGRSLYPLGYDVFWLNKGVAVQGENNTCVGGTECVGQPAQAIAGQEVQVYIVPGSVMFEQGFTWPNGLPAEFLERWGFSLASPQGEWYAPAVCPGVTGPEGCENPVFGRRPNRQALMPLVSLVGPDNLYGDDIQDEFGASLPGSWVISIPPTWLTEAGPHQFTAYINYGQQYIPEGLFSNNYFVITIDVARSPDRLLAFPLPAGQPEGAPRTDLPAIQHARNLSPLGEDVFWMSRGLAIQGESNLCVGGTECPNGPAKALPGQHVRLFVFPEGVVFGQGFQWPEDGGLGLNRIIYGDWYVPALCPGLTGPAGCADPIYALRTSSPLENLGQNHLPAGPLRDLFENQISEQAGQDFASNLPFHFEFIIPPFLLPSAGTYQFTAYVNYNQEYVPESAYGNNYFVVTIQAEASPFAMALASAAGNDPTAKRIDPYTLPLAVATLPPSNQAAYDQYAIPSVLVMQNDVCVQGCANPRGWLYPNLPVEVYMLAMEQQGILLWPADPAKSAVAVCPGNVALSGCNSPLAMDPRPYQFAQSLMMNLLVQNYSGYLARFTIPGEWFSSAGIHPITLLVNYNLQAGPTETVLANNLKVIDLLVR